MGRVVGERERSRALFLSVLKEPAQRPCALLEALSLQRWHGLFAVAHAYRLFPEFCAGLDTAGSFLVPPELRALREELLSLHVCRNRLYDQELLRLQTVFAEVGVRVVALKGTALSRMLYGSPHARHSPSDIDLYAGGASFDAAAAALEGAGYRSNAASGGCRRNGVLSRYEQVGFIREQGGETFLVELHRQLRSPFAQAPLPGWEARLQELVIGPVSVVVLGPLDLIAYLSLLTVPVSEFTEVRYVFALHRAVLRYPEALRSAPLAALCADPRTRRCLCLALGLAQSLFATPLPPEAAASLRGSGARLALARVFLNSRTVMTKENDASRGWYYFFSLWHYLVTSLIYSRRAGEAVSLTLRKLFPTRPQMEMLYGGPPRSSASRYLWRLSRPLARSFRKGESLMNPKARFKKNPDIVTRTIEEETILMPLYESSKDINCIYTLNAVGARIWHLVDGKKEVAQIKAQLQKEFEVSAQTLDRQVESFLKDLTKIKALLPA